MQSADDRPETRHDRQSDRAVLTAIAREAMWERGMEPDFPAEALQELADIPGPARATSDVRDLRGLLWASIDNDESCDLDQLTVAEPLSDGSVRILVAVADVDALVRKGSAIDAHAAHNTTSIYTPTVIFPMLPEELSTDLTSLNEDQDRLAVVVEMVFEADGALVTSDLYRASVRSKAKLAYRSVAAWLNGDAPAPPQILNIPDLQANLRLQDRVAQRLVELRHRQGALSLETTQAKAVFDHDSLSDLDLERKNRAKQLIEDFMIAANGVTASYLAARKFPSIRRVLRSPDRWDRIMQVATEHGERLPATPDAAALEAFLERQRKIHPEKFADLSLTVVKLMGRGEYAVDLPGDTPPGHFGLAVKDYAHSTAPNRRFPDLITQRLLKAAIAGKPSPYSIAELAALAKHCMQREDDAAKIERRMMKSAAVCLLSGKIGMSFDAIITGASRKGTWLRVFQPPVEGRLERGFQGLDVGDRVRVKLVHTDLERGFIDFVRD